MKHTFIITVLFLTICSCDSAPKKVTCENYTPVICINGGAVQCEINREGCRTCTCANYFPGDPNKRP